MTVSHLDNLDINIFLEAAPAPVRGFSNVLYLVDEADGNPLDGSSRYLTFNKPSDVTDAFGLSYIKSTTRDGCLAMFAQDPAPPAVLVGIVKTAATELETYHGAYDPDMVGSGGLEECIRAGAQFYGVVTDLRETADDAAMLLLSGYIESGVSRPCLLGLMVGSDVEWGASTALPSTGADWSAASPAGVEGAERTILIYHDDEGEFAAEAYLANRLAADPDQMSAPWDAAVASVGSYTTALTSTEKSNLYNETDGGQRVNIGLAYGSAPFFVDPGKTVSSGLGRPVYEMVTRDWFEARLQERIATMKVNESARFRKITIDARGQAKVLSVIEALLNQGLDGNSPHFIAKKATAEAITQADIDGQRLRFTVQAQLASSARRFEFNVYFNRSPLVL